MGHQKFLCAIKTLFSGANQTTLRFDLNIL